MRVCVPDDFPRGNLPGDVEFTGAEEPGVEFAVPTSWEAAEALERMHDLRVVQVLSAGIEWVEPHLPDGVTLCNAGDTRSPAVAQWVVGAILHDLDGVFLTPHNAGDTPEAERAALALARAQILRYRAGLPLEHVVRPGAAAR